MAENHHKYKYLENTYENLTLLGNAESKVYLAKSRVTGKIVVKKYIASCVVGIYEKLKNLEGKGIPKVYDYACDGQNGIVIESYICGETLEKKLAVCRTYSEEEAKKVICELLQILKEIHSKGIIHRDISAKNIIITDEGDVRLIDFGIAREVKNAKSRDTTILGTVGYAAPEQFGFQQSDARTDIYAVGVLLNQLLTGCMPTEQVYKRGVMGTIIKKSTSIDANKRYTSAEWMLRALRWAGNSEDLNGMQMLPGFRTNVKWKRVVACTGYGFMALYTYSSLREFAGIPIGFLLEMLALFLYWWLATLLVANIGYWDHVVYPICHWSRKMKVLARVIVWLFVFYAGVTLELYAKNTYLQL